jgi:FHA domain
LARRSRGAVDEPALPIITVDHVRAMREEGRLARVEVYPIPEAQSPDSPSAIVRSLPAGLEFSFPAETALPPRGEFRFSIDKAEPVVITGNGIVGRAPVMTPGAQLVHIEDPARSISRSHLGFEKDSRGRLMVFDLNSGNGTEIVTATGDRVECVPGRRYAVKDGDTILLGNFSVDVLGG